MMSRTWTWKISPGKGKGVFATRDLEIGALIMRDVETMKSPHNSKEPDAIQDSFDCLTPADQERYLQLHEGEQPLPTRIQRIFKANAFSSQDGNWGFVYLDICKANHSCIPNAEVIPHEDDSILTPRLVAIKPIARDEEIFITYNPAFHMKPRQDRQDYLRHHFDFECRCAICTAESHTVAMSDARRRLLSIVCPFIQDAGSQSIPELEILQKQAFSKSSPDIAEKWRELLLTSPSAVRCAFSLLTARILEAEGLPCYQAGSAYLDAATLLLSQMQERNDGIILLGAAENVKTWVRRGRDVVVALHGLNSATGKWANEYASNLEDKVFELAVAKRVRDKNRNMQAVARQCGDLELIKRLSEAFALQFFLQDSDMPSYRVISEGDCRTIVRLNRFNPTIRMKGARALDSYFEKHFSLEQ